MTLIPKIFGVRPASTTPQKTVYLQYAQAIPLHAALGRISECVDVKLIAGWIAHYSGYVREAAIARATELGDGALLEPLAARVNDWVPEVRRAATSALLTLLPIVPAAHFVAVLPALRALVSATRANHLPWLREFEQQLVQAGGLAAIVNAMDGDDFRLKRTACQVAFDHELLPVADMVKRGLTSGDIVLARQAVALLDRIPAGERQSCIDLAACSPFGPVRYAVFAFAARNHVDAGNEPILWRAIFDSQGSLRSAAARLLAEHGHDVASRCRTLLESGSLSSVQIRAGLSLLTELLVPEAKAVLESYTNDDRANIRAHALALLAKTSPADKDGIAARALLDPARRVRKAGVRLCVLGAFVTLEQIRAMLDRYGDRHAALAVCSRDQWDSLVCIALIAAQDEPSAEHADEMRRALERWLANPISMWTSPGARHREILAEPSIQSRLAAVAHARLDTLRSRVAGHGITL
ncbi:hypothetical protein [Burkholderia lata]|uniref:HEAT repeat domain-containing protein n=1 Tax=Burkholderia lata (strain ATCC 17760 / DSM 23089 / LMG 22485 / NCIMB 9086 / R18194 / 383) TaxID=482957 RepID=A0A6P2UHF8_BURL3|nr:hypothetical protein [Burkholderia lata]VWC69252.1 hypothetical protein BLA18109_02364 [Burkholderia lata]